MFVGITFPFFGALLGFFGGFAFAPTTYFVSPWKVPFYILSLCDFISVTALFNTISFFQLPCIMWLAVYKPKRFSFSWLTNWVCSIASCFLLIVIFNLIAFEVETQFTKWASLFSDLHYSWTLANDSVTNRRIKANHTQCQELRVLHLNLGCAQKPSRTFKFHYEISNMHIMNVNVRPVFAIYPALFFCENKLLLPNLDHKIIQHFSTFKFICIRNHICKVFNCACCYDYTVIFDIKKNN